MKTFCVKVTEGKIRAYKVVLARDEAAAIDKAVHKHWCEAEGCPHPVGVIEQWYIAGRINKNEPWEPIADGFRSQDHAVDWLKRAVRARRLVGWVEFYINWNSNQNPAQLFARLIDSGLWFELPSGAQCHV